MSSTNVLLFFFRCKIKTAMILFLIEKEKKALMKYTINDILRHYDFKDMNKEAFIKLAFLWKHDPKLKNAKNLKEVIIKLHELSLTS